MITYDWEQEKWTEDYTFCNFSMAPEGDPRMFDKVFFNWDDFYEAITCGDFE